MGCHPSFITKYVALVHVRLSNSIKPNFRRWWGTAEMWAALYGMISIDSKTVACFTYSLRRRAWLANRSRSLKGSYRVSTGESGQSRSTPVRSTVIHCEKSIILVLRKQGRWLCAFVTIIWTLDCNCPTDTSNPQKRITNVLDAARKPTHYRHHSVSLKCSDLLAS